MRKTMIGLMFLAMTAACLAGSIQIYGGELKEDTAVTVPVGPFEDDAGDGVLVTVVPSDMNADFVYSGGARVENTNLSNATNLLTIVAGTDPDAWGTILITAANTATVGPLIMTLWDDGANICEPITYRFDVVTADYYNLKYTVSTIATVANITAAVNQDVSISDLSAFGTCTKNAIVLADDDFAVLYDPVYCPILIVDATDGKTYTRICTGYANRTLTIFPSLPITPVTGDTVYMRRTFGGLLTSDLQQFIQR